MGNEELKIYHNSRCRISREALQLIQQRGFNPDIIQYLNDPPSKEELKNILAILNYKPIELVRTNEEIWKRNFKNKTLNENDIINAMIDYPKLIERPIIINKNKAVVGRPPENVLKILS